MRTTAGSCRLLTANPAGCSHSLWLRRLTCSICTPPPLLPGETSFGMAGRTSRWAWVAAHAQTATPPATRHRHVQVPAGLGCRCPADIRQELPTAAFLIPRPHLALPHAYRSCWLTTPSTRCSPTSTWRPTAPPALLERWPAIQGWWGPSLPSLPGTLRCRQAPLCPLAPSPMLCWQTRRGQSAPRSGMPLGRCCRRPLDAAGEGRDLFLHSPSQQFMDLCMSLFSMFGAFFVPPSVLTCMQRTPPPQLPAFRRQQRVNAWARTTIPCVRYTYTSFCYTKYTTSLQQTQSVPAASAMLTRRSCTLRVLPASIQASRRQSSRKCK